MTATQQKNVPTLRFSEFTASLATCALGSLTKIYDGTHQTPRYVKSGVPFYSVEHLTADQFDNTKFISEAAFENESKRVNLEKGDILMTRIGSIGVSKYIDWEVRASFYVSLALIKKSNKIDGRYLNSAIQSGTFQRELWKRTIHVAFPQKINLGEIGHCIIHVPKIEEQQKIAAFLSSVDTKIEQLGKKKALLEQYKKGMMQKLFSQEIRFKDEQRKDYPDWEGKYIRDICEINPSCGRLPNNFTYIDLESVYQGVLVKKNKTSSHDAPSRAQRILKKRDVLFQTVRPYQQNNFYFDLEGGYVASTGYAQLRAIESARFLYYLLHEQKFVRKVIACCTGTSYPAINSNDIGTINVYVPMEEEQQKIADFLSAIDRKIELVAAQLEQAWAFKKGLLQQMFI